MVENLLENSIYDNREVAQGNPLIDASKCFSTIEGRLFYLAVMELNQHFPNSKFYDTEFSDIVIPAETVIRVLGGNNRLYKDLVNIAEKLLKKTITIKIKKENNEFKWIGYTIFRRMEFDTKEGGLKIRFSDDMKPYLLDLHETPFTNVNSRIVFALQSSYSVRLMELMLKYKNAPFARNKNQIIKQYELEDLKILFQLKQGQYKAAKDFRIKCIDSPIAEINKSTRYHMTYETIKTGRKITGFLFTLTLPNDFDKQEREMATIEETIERAEKKETIKIIEKINEAQPPNKITTDPLSSEEELLNRLKGKGVLKGASRKWLNTYGFEKMYWVEQYVDKKAQNGDVRKYGAYYRTIIESDEYELFKNKERIEIANEEKRQKEIMRIKMIHAAAQKAEEEKEAKRKEDDFLAMGIPEIRCELKRLYEMRDGWLMSHKESEIKASIFMKNHMKIIEKYEDRLRKILRKNSHAEYGIGIIESDKEISSDNRVSVEKQQQLNDMIGKLLEKMSVKY